MSDRVACASCGKWMFHLAARCPHCGTVQPARSGQPLTVSADEARALLQTTGGERRASFADIAAEFVLPRGGALDAVLSVIAGPLTVVTVLICGYFLLRERPSRRDDQLAGVQLLGVPLCALLVAVSLFELEAPAASYPLLGASVLAWLIRAVRRSSRSLR